MKAALGRYLLRKLRGESLELCLRNLFTGYRIDLVLDVGANRGSYADLWRDRVGYSGTLLSFEPIPELAASLARRAQGDPAWMVIAEAVGDRNEVRTLRVPPADVLSSFRTANPEAPAPVRAKLDPTRLLDVPVRRLDTSVPAMVPDAAGRRIHLKTDTQGFDMEVLRGLGALAPAVVSLQLELSFIPPYAGVPPVPDQLRELDALGFDVCGLYPIVRRGLTLVEGDCVLLRRAARPAPPSARSGPRSP
ncbi:MAG: FkbM family methyltransferase [Gemmatimonadales bacterium]